MKLASKIVLLCLLAMTAMSALFTYVIMRRDEQTFADEHSRYAAALAAALKPQLSAATAGGGHDALADTMKACSVEFRQVRLRYVRFDESNSELKPSVPKPLLATVFEKKQLTVTTTGSDGQRSLHTYIPFRHDGSDGGLEVSRPMTDVDDRARGTLRNSVLAVLGASLLCAGVVIFGGIGLIGRPLSKLVEKTRRIGAGDFSEPVQLPGNSELSHLGSALNALCDQLVAQQAAIEAEVNSRLLAEQQLRHADRLNTVGRLAAGIAHEMGTPLNVVSGRAALIATGKLSADEVRQSAATIKSAADRITKIIRHLLDFARQSTPHKTCNDVRTLVEQTVDLLRNFAEQQHVTIDVATAGEGFESRVDAGQIQQVFANLIINAVQAMDAGGALAVRLSGEHASPPGGVEAEPGDFIRVDFTDTGCGITAEDRQLIFEPFFTTKDVGEGTGLGLAISYGILCDHAGWIEVTSKPGAGSCFSVFLPLVRDQQAN